MKKVLKIKKDGGNSVEPKSEYVTTLREKLETPIAPLSYCALVKLAYFQRSSVGRSKVVLSFNPVENHEHIAFLKELEKIADEEGVGTVGRMKSEKEIAITFQAREKPKIFTILDDGTQFETELEEDLPNEIPTRVEFELRKYFDRFQKCSAFSFKPLKIFFHLNDKLELETQEGE